MILTGILLAAIFGATWFLVKPSVLQGVREATVADATPQDNVAVPDTPITPQPLPTPTRNPWYSGGLDGLPDVAQHVLSFATTGDPNETIEDRVLTLCHLDEYAGSTKFPGSILIGKTDDLGWTYVTWNVACPEVDLDGKGLVFRLSHDRRYIKGVSQGARMLLLFGEGQ